MSACRNARRVDRTLLFGALSTLLHTCRLVLVVSAAAGGPHGANEPLASAQLFDRLGVEQGRRPAGVLRLRVNAGCADLLESADRAVFVLPDEPGSLAALLAVGRKRLAQKVRNRLCGSGRRACGGAFSPRAGAGGRRVVRFSSCTGRNLRVFKGLQNKKEADAWT